MNKKNFNEVLKQREMQESQKANDTMTLIRSVLLNSNGTSYASQNHRLSSPKPSPFLAALGLGTGAFSECLWSGDCSHCI